MKILKPHEAIAVLNRIEYSSDGFVKRYPSEDEYETALATLREFIRAEAVDSECVVVSRANFRILYAAYNERLRLSPTQTKIDADGNIDS